MPKTQVERFGPDLPAQVAALQRQSHAAFPGIVDALQAYGEYESALRDLLYYLAASDAPLTSSVSNATVREAL